MVCDPGQLSVICTQKKKKTQTPTESSMKRNSCVLEGKLTTANSIQTSQYLNNIMLLKCGVFFQGSSTFLPTMSAYCSSLSCVLCQAPSCFHSSLLSCILAVVQCVTINKNCESKLPGMMRRQTD